MWAILALQQDLYVCTDGMDVWTLNFEKCTWCIFPKENLQWFNCPTHYPKLRGIYLEKKIRKGTGFLNG